MNENVRPITIKKTVRMAFRAEPIYQYDTGHVLQLEGFDGLPETFQMHYAFSPAGESITQIGQNNQVELPDMYAQGSRVIYAWLYIADSESGLTKYSIEIPVISRAKPSDAEPTPAQESAIDQAIAALNAGVTRSEAAADLAEGYAETASGYAESAYQSSEAAGRAAEDAAAAVTAVDAKVEEAAGYATAAAGSAGAAAQSVTDAGDAATAAAGSAGTAATKAGEAAESATAAAGSAEDAAEVLADFQEEKADLEQDIADLNNALSYKQDSPETAGTAGQVLALDNNLDPVWTDPSADVDVSALAPVIKSSASGEIASFADGADNRVIDSLVVNIEPVQDLHGQDAPYPPGGGANKWDEQWEVGSISTSTGADVSSTEIIRSIGYTAVDSTLTYTLVKPGTSTGSFYVLYYDSNKAYLENESIGGGASYKPLTLPEGTAYVRIRFGNAYGTTYGHDVALNTPETITTYSPYANECPISGWEGANVKGTGINVFDKTNYHVLNGYISSGKILASNSHKIVYIECKPNTMYAMSNFSGNNRKVLHYSDSLPVVGSELSGGTQTITTGANAKYICTYCYNGNVDTITFDDVLNALQITVGSTIPDTYHAYTGTSLPISWSSQAGVVYGGQVEVKADGSCRLMVDRYEHTFDGTESLSLDSAPHVLKFVGQSAKGNYPAQAKYLYSHGIGSGNGTDSMPDNSVGARTNGNVFIKNGQCTTLQDFKTWLETQYANGTPVQVSYILATPIIYDLPSVEALKTLLGVNNIWADCGSIQNVTYSADTKLYIDNKLSELVAQIVNS